MSQNIPNGVLMKSLPKSCLNLTRKYIISLILCLLYAHLFTNGTTLKALRQKSVLHSVEAPCSNTQNICVAIHFCVYISVCIYYFYTLTITCIYTFAILVCVCVFVFIDEFKGINIFILPNLSHLFRGK